MVDFNITYFFITGCYSMIFLYLANLFWNVAAERQIKRIRFMLFQAIVSKEMSYFEKKSPGEISSDISK